MPQRVARSGDFGKQEYDIRDVRDICERAGRNESWVEFRSLPLIAVSLGFQTLVVVKWRMRF